MRVRACTTRLTCRPAGTRSTRCTSTSGRDLGGGGNAMVSPDRHRPAIVRSFVHSLVALSLWSLGFFVFVF